MAPRTEIRSHQYICKDSSSIMICYKKLVMICFMPGLIFVVVGSATDLIYHNCYFSDE